MSQKETILVFNLAKDIKELKDTIGECEMEDDIIISVLENTNEIIDIILKRKFKKIYK